jgi:hypothetical protein
LLGEKIEEAHAVRSDLLISEGFVLGEEAVESE